MILHLLKGVLSAVTIHFGAWQMKNKLDTLESCLHFATLTKPFNDKSTELWQHPAELFVVYFNIYPWDLSYFDLKSCS